MGIPFLASLQPTVGLELEVQLLHRENKQLISLAPELLRHLPSPGFKWELFQCTIEINTGVCRSFAQLEADLQEKLHLLERVAAEHGAEVLLSGTHPFAHWRDQKITENPRYLNLLRRIRWPVRQFLIFGLHIHVGVEDGNLAIALLNRIKPFLPHLIALSASSPYWIGFDTGLASCRVKIFEALPNAGLPPALRNWDDFSELLQSLLDTDAIQTPRDIWWDVRPHAQYGTLEVRICDLMPTVKENLALSALVVCLVEKLKQEPGFAPLPERQGEWILAQNKWRAARYGLDATLIREPDQQVPLRQELQQLLEELLSLAEAMNISSYFQPLFQILRDGASYQRQRAWFRKTKGDLKQVIQGLQEEYRTNRILAQIPTD